MGLAHLIELEYKRMGLLIPTYTQGPPRFEPFPKIPRLNRDVVITEKIDGTNACIFVTEGLREVYTASRKRWITPGSDNAGFARWAAEHVEELRELGPGYHFGEWWGNGIQRGYGLENGDKRFSLFNVGRWSLFPTGKQELPPACCSIVPILATGPLVDACNAARRELEHGSAAAPGYDRPEGFIVYHTAAGTLFKVTLEGDEKPKGSQE